MIVKNLEVFARGPGLKSAIQSVEAEFTVDASNIPGKHIEVDITGSFSKILRYDMCTEISCCLLKISMARTKPFH